MRKIFIILLIALSNFAINAQQTTNSQSNFKILSLPQAKQSNVNSEVRFNLTKDGWSNYQDNAKSFTVYECEGLNESEIYSLIYKYFTSKSESRYDKITGTPNSLIVFNSRINGALVDKEGTYYDIEFSFSVDIKNGKIRFNYPEVLKCWLNLPVMKTDIGNNGFKKTCQEPGVKFSLYKHTINMYITGIVADLSKEVKNKDW